MKKFPKDAIVNVNSNCDDTEYYVSVSVPAKGRRISGFPAEQFGATIALHVFEESFIERKAAEKFAARVTSSQNRHFK